MTRSTQQQGRSGSEGGFDAPSGCDARRRSGRPESAPGECGPMRFRFGPHGPHGHGRGPWSRARRGNVRAAILSVLADEPMHGYQIMQRLEERSGGMWRPSPGSVYPTLQLLEDQGFIKGEEVEGRRVFSLTEAGKAEAAASKEAHGTPWESAEQGDEGPRFKLRKAVFQIASAAKQVGTTGSSEQVDKALAILADARKRIYELLAEGD
jgi:DNA-binding PadR family transcriptional regulator